MEEVYLYVQGFEGYYEVSNFGNVRSVDHNVMYKDGRIYKYKGQKIKPTPDKKGYLQVGFNRNGVKTTHRIHSLVAETFIPIPPSEDPLEVNHIDGEKSNNNSENLEWVTSSENTRKGYEIGLFDNARSATASALKGNQWQAKRLIVFEKETGLTKLYPSAVKAAMSYGHGKRYFHNLIRAGKENGKFKVEYADLGEE